MEPDVITKTTAGSVDDAMDSLRVWYAKATATPKRPGGLYIPSGLENQVRSLLVSALTAAVHVNGYSLRLCVRAPGSDAKRHNQTADGKI